MTEVQAKRPKEPAVIVDAVLHAFNLSVSNTRTPLAEDILGMTYGLVQMTGDGDKISQEQFLRDWSAEDLAEVAFVESDVDVGVYHGVPWWDYFNDGFVANEKGIEMHKRWPQRVLFYGTLDPLRDDALEQVEYLVGEGGACGLKLYPENWHHGTRSVSPVRLDDDVLAPLLERAVELSVPVAIHKVIPAGQGHTDNYLLTDVETAARRYPELQIEVVHSGYAFLQETAYLMTRYGNVWANLEVTSAYAVNGKRRFADGLGTLLGTGAWDRIIFASGAVQVHPQTVLEALYDFQIPEEMTIGYGVPQISDQMRAGILGDNFLRLHGLDGDSIRTQIASDEFSLRKRDGVGARWGVAQSW